MNNIYLAAEALLFIGIFYDLIREKFWVGMGPLRTTSFFCCLLVGAAILPSPYAIIVLTMLVATSYWWFPYALKAALGFIYWGMLIRAKNEELLKQVVRSRALGQVYIAPPSQIDQLSTSVTEEERAILLDCRQKTQEELTMYQASRRWPVVFAWAMVSVIILALRYNSPITIAGIAIVLGFGVTWYFCLDLKGRFDAKMVREFQEFHEHVLKGQMYWFGFLCAGVAVVLALTEYPWTPWLSALLLTAIVMIARNLFRRSSHH
jgi:hypothetical protein